MGYYCSTHKPPEELVEDTLTDSLGPFPCKICFAPSKTYYFLTKPGEEIMDLRKKIGEYCMSKKDEVTIKKDNLLKAYRHGCEDVKEILGTLFPDVCQLVIKIKIGQIWLHCNKYYYLTAQDLNGDLFLLPMSDTCIGIMQATRPTPEEMSKKEWKLLPNATITVDEGE